MGGYFVSYTCLKLVKWQKVNSYSFIFSVLVSKFAPGSDVHIHMNIERAEGEILAESVHNYWHHELAVYMMM